MEKKKMAKTEKISKTKTIGKSVSFCLNCDWIEIDDDEIRICPKCNKWVWTVYQYRHFDGKKVIGWEAGLTDNDESYIQASTLKELKKIFDKAMEVFNSNGDQKHCGSEEEG